MHNIEHVLIFINRENKLIYLYVPVIVQQLWESWNVVLTLNYPLYTGWIWSNYTEKLIISKIVNLMSSLKPAFSVTFVYN